MLGQRFAVDEILYLAFKDLGDECMPARNAAAARVKDVVLFPIRFRTESSPGGRIQRGSGTSPTAIRQILEIQLAVIGIHGRL